MTDVPTRALLLTALGAFLTATPLVTDSAAARRPSVTILCLPPGGTKPVACATAARNSLIEVHPGPMSAPHYLIFSEVDAVGPPRIVRVPVAAAARQGGPVQIGIPQQLCAHPDVDRWKVRLATGGSRPTSVGAMTVRC